MVGALSYGQTQRRADEFPAIELRLAVTMKAVSKPRSGVEIDFIRGVPTNRTLLDVELCAATAARMPVAHSFSIKPRLDVDGIKRLLQFGAHNQPV